MIYVVAVLFIVFLAALCVKYLARSFWVVTLFLLLSLSTLALMTELIGRPKPVNTEWLLSHVSEVKIVSEYFVEGEGIYLWIVVPWENFPRSYQFPWDKKFAQSLRDARRDAGERDLMLGDPFGKPWERFQRSWDDRKPLLYPKPQPMLPEKFDRIVPEPDERTS